MREIRPTHIVAVPRVYEKIHGRIHAGVQQGSALKRAIFNWAITVGRRFNRSEASGGAGPSLALQHRAATALVFKKIHAATGGNIGFYVSTGAPLAKGLAEFFDAIVFSLPGAWACPSPPRRPRTSTAITASAASASRDPGSRSRSPKRARSVSAAKSS